MIAYFTASIAGKKIHGEKYQKIIDLLTLKGIEVTADHIMDTTEAQIRMETREERLAFQRQLEKWIQGCDFMVAETSFPSISVGYEISMAIHRGKPVLILHSVGDPPSLLGHNNDERIVCEKYTPETLSDTINDFLYYIRRIA